MNVFGTIRRQRMKKRGSAECAALLGLTLTMTKFPQGGHRGLSLTKPGNHRLTDCLYCR
jgi:hypothetical protein